MAEEGSNLASATRILVVEDDESISMGLRMNLEAEGYHVEVAEDGEIGLEHARQYAPDLIILDIMLPKLNGLEILRTLRDEGTTVPRSEGAGEQLEVAREVLLVFGSQFPRVDRRAQNEQVDRFEPVDVGALDALRARLGAPGAVWCWTSGANERTSSGAAPLCVIVFGRFPGPSQLGRAGGAPRGEALRRGTGRGTDRHT